MPDLLNYPNRISPEPEKITGIFSREQRRKKLKKSILLRCLVQQDNRAGNFVVETLVLFRKPDHQEPDKDDQGRYEFPEEPECRPCDRRFVPVHIGHLRPMSTFPGVA